jgi:hypothetical protein
MGAEPTRASPTKRPRRPPGSRFDIGETRDESGALVTARSTCTSRESRRAKTIVPTAVAMPTAMNSPEEIDSLLPDVVGTVPGVAESVTLGRAYAARKRHTPHSTEDDAGIHRRTTSDADVTSIAGKRTEPGPTRCSVLLGATRERLPSVRASV